MGWEWLHDGRSLSVGLVLCYCRSTGWEWELVEGVLGCSGGTLQGWLMLQAAQIPQLDQSGHHIVDLGQFLIATIIPVCLLLLSKRMLLNVVHFGMHH